MPAPPPRPPAPAMVVAGTGATGLAAALALARCGVATALVGPPPAADGRTAALFTGSVALLRSIGVWGDIAAACAPIRGIRIVDDMGGVLRAPETLFLAEEAGADAICDGVLGYNVPNAALTAALAARVAGDARIDWSRHGHIVRLEAGPESAAVVLDDGETIVAQAVVAADGRHSVCRAGAGIAARTWHHDQSALVTSFTHGRSHTGISTEFHRRGGPLTVVPLPGDASSLVWVDRPDAVEALLALDEAAFREALETRLMGLLGVVREIGPRRAFPLSGLAAAHVAANRVLLAGEAAHVFPPIGAQGLNLGLRDVAALADIVSQAVTVGRDPGHPAILARYDAARRGDITSRTLAVTALGATLTSGWAPVTLARGLGLHGLARLPALKRAVMREGLGPPGPSPEWLQQAAGRD